MAHRTSELRRQARSAAREKLAGRTGRRFWKALEELTDTPAFRRAIQAEFPQPLEDLSKADRHQVLRAMGASLGLAGLAVCSFLPDLRARPYVTTPPHTVLGAPRAYATAVTYSSFAQPVLGTTYEGRPTKLEGLPEHPACKGSTDAFTQAALLGLYDPDRSRGPRRMGRLADWSAFAAALATRRGAGLRLLTRASTSPTFERQLAELMQRWPQARWHVFEPVSDDLRLEAARLAFGRPLQAQPRFERCQALVSFDGDFLGPGPRLTTQARARTE